MNAFLVNGNSDGICNIYLSEKRNKSLEARKLGMSKKMGSIES
jgi:hypothetical protein